MRKLLTDLGEVAGAIAVSAGSWLQFGAGIGLIVSGAALAAWCWLVGE